MFLCMCVHTLSKVGPSESEKIYNLRQNGLHYNKLYVPFHKQNLGLDRRVGNWNLLETPHQTIVGNYIIYKQL